MRRTAIWLGAATLAATLGWWWQGAAPDDTDALIPAASAVSSVSAAGRALTPWGAVPPRPATPPTSLQPQEADPLLHPGLRDTLEALLHAAGDAPTPEELKRRLASLVGQHFPPDLTVRALAMATRYVDYRVALGQISPPADPNDPHALRSAAEQRRKLRMQHFDFDEYQALFGQQQVLDDYTLERLEIERNPALSSAQKRQALDQAQAQLPASLQAERAESVAHVALAEQTAHFNAQKTDDSTRYAQRRAAHGAAAAERLAQLDRQERDWNARLDQYQQAIHQGRDATHLQALRNAQFTPEEQLRIDAALALRAQK